MALYTRCQSASIKARKQWYNGNIGRMHFPKTWKRTTTDVLFSCHQSKWRRKLPKLKVVKQGPTCCLLYLHAPLTKKLQTGNSTLNWLKPLKAQRTDPQIFVHAAICSDKLAIFISWRPTNVDPTNFVYYWLCEICRGKHWGNNAAAAD